jgi:hypothetical protein
MVDVGDHSAQRCLIVRLFDESAQPNYRVSTSCRFSAVENGRDDQAGHKEQGRYARCRFEFQERRKIENEVSNRSPQVHHNTNHPAHPLLNALLSAHESRALSTHTHIRLFEATYDFRRSRMGVECEACDGRDKTIEFFTTDFVHLLAIVEVLFRFLSQRYSAALSRKNILQPL